MATQTGVLKGWMGAAHKQGWRVRRTGSGHYCWITPAGKSIFTPSTPGRGRSMNNTRAQLRRAGLRIP